MNKVLKCCFILTAALTPAFMMTSCSPKSESQKETVAEVIQKAQSMSRNELYKKAMEELRGKEMNGIGNSSRGATAKEYFLAYLQGKSATLSKTADGKKVWSYEIDEEIRKEFPDYDENFDGKISWQQPKNNSIFTMLDGDIKGSSHTFSMTLIQDANQIQSKMLDTNLLLNYIPNTWQGVEGINGHPFTLQSLNKVFEFNTIGTNEDAFKNVWQFVESDVHPQFMAPNSELIGKNFLMMLTKKEYATKVKDAYLSYASTDTAQDFEAVINKYESYGDPEKYVYAWIESWIKQISIQTDDAPICQNLVKSSSKGQCGLLVYSKLRSVSETKDASKNNVAIAAYNGIEGFGGFMYKHYLLIPKTAPLPWTACAFIEFMTCTKDGFSAWGKDIGGYCSNPFVNQDHSKDGSAQNNDGIEYPAMNDKGYEWWMSSEDGKGQMIIEDPIYLSKVSYNVGSLIDTLCEQYDK